MDRQAKAAARALLLGLVLLAGCGTSSTDPNDQQDEDGHPPPEMVGVWIFQSATFNDSPVALADILDWEPGTAQAKLHIEANGGYQYEEVNSSGGQTWAEGGWIFVDPEGGTIVIHSQYDSNGSNTDTSTIDYELAGGVLTLTVVEFSDTTVFTLTK